MSSGFNGIPIRSVGRVRIKLAAMLNDKLALRGFDRIQPEDLARTNPNHRRYEDCCAWDCWTAERNRRHIFSWATMSHLVKTDFTVDDPKAIEIEV